MAFRSSFEREKLSSSNFNDWFHSPKIVLRVDKKWSVIEQPIPLDPPADSKYLRSGMRFMMLIMGLLVLCSEAYDWMMGRVRDPRVEKDRLKGGQQSRAQIEDLDAPPEDLEASHPHYK
ncbi:hypothetical protein Tco_0956044 [Tanacetum coccineum]|uniref:Uncharacterized protein n=1 Tax=Tanacetum coccineum TaxID=301880 RepID=A0ABQ5E8W6_9ASTR